MQSFGILIAFVTRASLTGPGIPEEVVAIAVDENQDIVEQPDGRTTA